METILFVDDEQFVLDGFKRLLREYRNTWHLEFAHNGREAFEIVRNTPVDAIITDLRMPEMTGLDLLEQLQADEKTQNIPVVILTGAQEREMKWKALEMGAVDLLNKPVDKEDLVARIQNILKIKHYHDVVLEKNKALEKQLVLSQKMDLVGVMAAGAVHDLNNLLSIIVGYSNLLIEEDLLNNIEASSITKISKASEKAASLVNQILKFSRLEEDIRTINVGDLVNDILSTVATLLPLNVTIQWEKPKESIYINSKAVQLQQILLNLCINGIQAMEDSGGVLSVILDSAKNEMIRIVVQDTGVGMDHDIMQKIYLPLFTTKKQGKGTGLGLFVVKHIIDEHKGKIEVQSEPQKGTTFQVFFPLSVHNE